MRCLQLLLTAAVLGITLIGCATAVGTWEGGSNDLDAAALQREVESALAARSWLTMPTEAGDLTVEKSGAGGQQTWANLEFVGSPNGGSTFRLTGYSHHVVNWLTFGILGLALQNKARQECADFVESWVHTGGRTATR